MRIHSALAAAAALAATAALAGCSSGPEPLHARTVTLPPGEFAEVNLVLATDDTISWSWSVAGPGIDFNLHTHGEGAAALVQLSGATRHDGNFTAPQAGTYSLYWLNTSRHPVELTYEVHGSGRLDPGHPPVP